MRREDLSILALGRLTLALLFVSKAQGGEVKTFTHENNPVTVSAGWERVPDEELKKKEAELEERAKRLGLSRPGATPVGFGYTWNLSFWTNSAAGSNHCCSFWMNYGKGMYLLERLGDPVIYDAMLLSNGSLLLVYGNGVETRCEDFLLTATNITLRGICKYVYIPEDGRIERAFLKAERATNVVACLVDNSGVTNKAVWHGPGKWEKLTAWPKWKQW